MGIWDSITSGVSSAYNATAGYVKDTAVMAKESGWAIIAPNATLEARFQGLSNFAGFIPVVGDMAEAGCSVISTGISIAKDPKNWKQITAEGAADLAVTFAPGPKLLLKPLEKKATAFVGKKLFKAGTEAFDEAVESTLTTGLIHEKAQTLTEEALTESEQKASPADLKLKSSHELLKIVKDDYITHLKQNGKLTYDENGKPVIGEEDKQAIYSTYKNLAEIAEKSGTKVIISPSHMNEEVLPGFHVIRSDDVKNQKNHDQASIDATALPNFKQQQVSLA